jgi:hypothetical protein
LGGSKQPDLCEQDRQQLHEVIPSEPVVDRRPPSCRVVLLCWDRLTLLLATPLVQSPEREVIVNETTTAAPPEDHSRRNWRRGLAWALSVLFWLLLSGLRWDLAVVGFIFAAVIRGLYVLVMRRSSRHPVFWSPYIFTIAGLVAAVSLVGQQKH